MRTNIVPPASLTSSRVSASLLTTVAAAAATLLPAAPATLTALGVSC